MSPTDSWPWVLEPAPSKRSAKTWRLLGHSNFLLLAQTNIKNRHAYRCWLTERDGCELVEVGLDRSVEVVQLKVAAANAALADEALGDGVEGDHLDRLGRLDRRRVRGLLHLKHDLAERDEVLRSHSPAVASGATADSLAGAGQRGYSTLTGV